VELFGTDALVGQPSPPEDGSVRTRRNLERSWPIDEHLKNDNADGLFLWIGSRIAEVVRQGREAFDLPADKPLPLGVTFSFPMNQASLSEATLMSMGKGFAVSADLDLGSRLLEGYNCAKDDNLPPICVAAIANDSVSTLVSFIFKFDTTVQRRASMGLILGTGSNATIPLKLSRLHPSKRPPTVSVLPGESVDDVKIAVNTEWSINGTAPPLRESGLVSRWDEVLDSQNETPGFQPLEYMTAGRYLGELGRIMLVDYMVSELGVARDALPAKLLQRHTMTTTFLSHFKPLEPAVLLSSLRAEFPESTSTSFSWTEELAEALFRIAKAVEVRAAGIIAAAILALLTLGDELPVDSSGPSPAVQELGVGYTGGCIVHFQDYLVDCQSFIDRLVEKRFAGGRAPVRVVLSPCHDGGITGAGILVAAASASEDAEM
jgi:hexokinase